MAVTTEEVTDRKGALQALKRCGVGLSKVQSVLADSGDVGQPFAQEVKGILGEANMVQIAKRLVGKGRAALEELRAMAQYQLAIHPAGLLGGTAQEIVNTFLRVGPRFGHFDNPAPSYGRLRLIM
ncbi:hypothetical protein HNQ59_003502 [Chitinivorax tropicus]|uniref:Uncharacterized protein n=1 Tax=Chitinivorax tropicus TaxID=714531 RepID=A0A840MRY8_9PROT|nr:hypothetical protein [Chitinivorax tropicus]